jgi:hypothetical protein
MSVAIRMAKMVTHLKNVVFETDNHNDDYDDINNNNLLIKLITSTIKIKLEIQFIVSRYVT